MHAELGRFVACGRHDATFPRSADCDRLPAQLRIVTLFDRCVERIHVDMDDLREPPASAEDSLASMTAKVTST